MSQKTLNRREFLKLTAVGVAVVPGPARSVQQSLRQCAPKASINGQWSLTSPSVSDAVTAHSACQAHNDVNPDIQWNKVTEVDMVADKHVFLPRPCMHCEKAPCVEVCPVESLLLSG